MTRTARDVRKLQSSVKALQNDLATVLEDLGDVASNGKAVGLDKAREQIDLIQERLGELVHGAAAAANAPADALRRSVSENPVASLAAAFAVGVAAASLLLRR